MSVSCVVNVLLLQYRLICSTNSRKLWNKAHGSYFVLIKYLHSLGQHYLYFYTQIYFVCDIATTRTVTTTAKFGSCGKFMKIGRI